MNKYKVMVRPTWEEPLTIEADSFYVDKESECIFFLDMRKNIIAAINCRECVYVIKEKN